MGRYDVPMIKINLNIRNDQFRSLKELSHDNSSEWIRVAIDERLEKIRREALNVSISLSKGARNG